MALPIEPPDYISIQDASENKPRSDVKNLKLVELILILLVAMLMVGVLIYLLVVVITFGLQPEYKCKCETFPV